jgi:hypothetical protein
MLYSTLRDERIIELSDQIALALTKKFPKGDSTQTDFCPNVKATLTICYDQSGTKISSRTVATLEG